KNARPHGTSASSRFHPSWRLPLPAAKERGRRPLVTEITVRSVSVYSRLPRFRAAASGEVFIRGSPGRLSACGLPSLRAPISDYSAPSSRYRRAHGTPFADFIVRTIVSPRLGAVKRAAGPLSLGPTLSKLRPRPPSLGGPKPLPGGQPRPARGPKPGPERRRRAPPTPT